MKNVLTYKDFIGRVDFSSEDEVFYGKIEGIEDLVTFEASSVSEMKKAFQDAVEDYLELCKDQGKNPFKSYKGSFNVRINPRTHLMAAREASKKGYSLNQWVEKAINEYLVSEPNRNE
ncbi:type II toxin-antitoxin system HicB family antitoxin [Algoriphagus namhaensis]